MPGVLFIVTIPTENEERGRGEQQPQFGHSSTSDTAEKYENGAYKFVWYFWLILFVLRDNFLQISTT